MTITADENVAPKQGEYRTALDLSRSDPQELYQARELLRKAHKNGDERATYALASWYLHGNDITEKNEEAGFAMLREIENSFIAEAIFDLAFAYDCGKCVEVDDLKAFSLYMRAALLGSQGACSQVSQYYSEGATIPHDPALAEAWQTRAEQEERAISPPYRLWLDD
ncbi:tetratricopeptide repeat protein [Sphingomonas psychrotolerans]|uniref:tetratricopeptide repeat protein n=1 Tax=Sphingomonas psychrotolerans TaxID=1327635 RepID=UPI0013051431|nr:SEL1-like repeat protein [Sphingomonas psychrotolerans]